MARNNQRGGRNNNPSGRNQYSSDWMDSVRERPMASAAAAAAAVGAGVFLWSKRNQISEQISRLSDQITDWSEERGSNSEMAMAGMDDTSSMDSPGTTSSSSSRSTSGKSGSSTSRSTSGRSRSGGQTMNAGSSSQGVTH